MQLTPDNLTDLLQYAISAAKEAGALIEAYASKNVDVEHKSGGDSPASQVVTEVDLLCDALITKKLTPTCEKYDLALLTEETEDDKARLHKQAFWCVDPLDGTLSFVQSIPGYSVSIALVAQSGEPLIGVIYDPVTQTLYHAVKGQGVFRNGEPWTLSPTSNESKRLSVIVDLGCLKISCYQELSKGMESVAIKHGCVGARVFEQNGAALNACWVLENAPACYVKCPKPTKGGGSVWDFSASAVLFNEIGAIASDVHGQPLDLNRSDSTFMNHRGVIFAIDKSLAEDIQQLVGLSSK